MFRKLKPIGIVKSENESLDDFFSRVAEARKTDKQYSYRVFDAVEDIIRGEVIKFPFRFPVRVSAYSIFALSIISVVANLVGWVGFWAVTLSAVLFTGLVAIIFICMEILAYREGGVDALYEPAHKMPPLRLLSAVQNKQKEYQEAQTKN